MVGADTGYIGRHLALTIIQGHADSSLPIEKDGPREGHAGRNYSLLNFYATGALRGLPSSAVAATIAVAVPVP